MSSSCTVYYKTHITAQTNFFSKSLSYIVQFQSLSVKSSVFIVACFVSMCNMNICYLEWREGAGFLFLLFFCWGLSDWHCLRFTALWLCLCTGAAEVMFWFAVLVPVSLDWPQDVVTILWPHPPTPKKNKHLWQLAWLLLLTAHPTFFMRCTPTHWLSSPSFICGWGTM